MTTNNSLPFDQEPYNSSETEQLETNHDATSVATTVSAAVSGGVAGAAIGRLMGGRMGATIGAIVGGVAGATLGNDGGQGAAHAVEHAVDATKEATQEATQQLKHSASDLTESVKGAVKRLKPEEQTDSKSSFEPQQETGSHHYTLSRNYDLSAETHYQLGVALGRQGKFDEAIEEFQEALTLAPGSAETHYNLGVAFTKQGDVEHGLEHMQHAKKICLERGNTQGVEVVEEAIDKLGDR